MPTVQDPADPSPTVVFATDGTPLHAEVRGNPDAPVTIVLSHGYLFNSASWCHQWEALSRSARVVTWDHRGHGLSGQGELSRMTIDQLGEDLHAVIEQTAGDGPVVLIGHSMGGMAILALAEQHPELFGTRVIGTALLTSAASPVDAGFTVPRQAATTLVRAGQQALALFRRLPLPTRALDAARRAFNWFLQSSTPSPPRDTPEEASAAGMVEQMSLEVIFAFVPEFLNLDKTAGLAAIGQTDALVVGAADDTVTGPDQSRAIAEAVPGARLVMLDGGGHNAHLDHPQRVNHHLRALLSRVTARHIAATERRKSRRRTKKAS